MSKYNRTIKTIESHTLGEPFRLVTSGIPELQGSDIISKRQWLLKEHDYIRSSLMLEPKGHADMYGGILTTLDPGTGSQFGVIFMHNEGYSDHCGHGTILIATILVELNWVTRTIPMTRFAIDAPCGTLKVEVEWDGDRAGRVFFENVESFVYMANLSISTQRNGILKGDLCFGGAFYFYLNLQQNGIDKEIDVANYDFFKKLGVELKDKINAENYCKHPFIEDINRCYGTIFDDYRGQGNRQRNCCVFADGQIDRSPTGSGTGGAMARLHHYGKLDKGEIFHNESIINTNFEAKIIRDGVDYGGFESVISKISGEAFIMGYSDWIIDDADPLFKGFNISV